MPDGKSTATPAKPTLKTISQISGLAVPTVSRALNDAPDIGTETKRLIRQIATDIGYVPNRAGVRLRTGRTNVISLVLSTDHNNHTGRLIASVAGELLDTPYHLVVTPFFPSEDPMKPVRYIVETGSADAVILNQIQPRDPRVAYLMDRGFPFATHGRSMWSARHPYYDFDNFAYGRVAADQLRDRGRRHIALLGPPMEHSYAQHMFDGVRTATERNGQSFHWAERVNSDESGNMILPQVEDLFAAAPLVDGIITASSNAAIAAIAAIERTGRRLGEDIDVFTKEAGPFLTLLQPELLTCSEAVGDAGVFLARAAMQAIKSPDDPPMQFLEVPEAG